MENSGNTNTILAVLTCVVIFFLMFEMFVNTENVNRVPDPPPVIQAPPSQKQNVVVNVTTPQQVAPAPTTVVVPVQRRRRRNNNDNDNDNYRRRRRRRSGEGNTPSINFNPTIDLHRERTNVASGGQYVNRPGRNSQQVEAPTATQVSGPNSDVTDVVGDDDTVLQSGGNSTSGVSG